MSMNYFVKLEDSIIIKHVTNNGRVNIKSALEELKANGYNRSRDTVTMRVWRLRHLGKIPMLNMSNTPHRVRCIETGIEYESLSQAGKSIGAQGSQIGRACINPKRYTANGFHWTKI